MGGIGFRPERGAENLCRRLRGLRAGTPACGRWLAVPLFRAAEFVWLAAFAKPAAGVDRRACAPGMVTVELRNTVGDGGAAMPPAGAPALDAVALGGVAAGGVAAGWAGFALGSHLIGLGGLFGGSFNGSGLFFGGLGGGDLGVDFAVAVCPSLRARRRSWRMP